MLTYRRCPFVKKPFDDCFCANLTSKTVESALYFCNKHYKKCEFFAKNAHKEHGENVFLNRGV